MRLVNQLPTAASLLVLASLAAPAMALDQIRTTDGKISSGTIEATSRTEVVITASGGAQQKVEVNKIDSLQFTGEPPAMSLIRSAIRQGNYDQALKNLEGVDPQKIEVLPLKQEIEFFSLRAKAGQALASGKMESLREAGSGITKFLEANPTTWRFYEISQLIGDLFLAMGETDRAIEAYKALENAPWDDYKMRGAIARGRAQQQSKQFEAALKSYEDALARGAGKDDPLIASQVLAATVGRAACLAETGKADEGIALMAGVIEKANPEDRELHAVAFVTSGNCYLKAGKPKEALLEFLKVDLLYNNYPAYHAEALYHLGSLWKVAAHPERAQEAQATLVERYPGSVWARQAP